MLLPIRHLTLAITVTRIVTSRKFLLFFQIFKNHTVNIVWCRFDSFCDRTNIWSCFRVSFVAEHGFIVSSNFFPSRGKPSNNDLCGYNVLHQHWPYLMQFCLLYFFGTPGHLIYMFNFSVFKFFLYVVNCHLKILSK